jgi:Tol biopolymer transport system component
LFNKRSVHLALWIVSLLIAFACGGNAKAPNENGGAPLNGDVAFISSAGAIASAIMLTNAAGEQPRQVAIIERGATSLSWFPDGKRLLVMTPGPTALVLDVSDGSQSEFFSRPPGAVGTLSISSDGKFFVYTHAIGNERGVWRVEVDSGSRQHLVQGAFNSAEISPDAKQIVLGSSSGLSLVNVDGSGVRQLTSGPATHPRWSPNAKYIAYERGDLIQIVEVGTGQTRQLTKGPAKESEARFSPDGMLVSFTRSDASDIQIYVIGLDGSAERRLTNAPGGGYSAAWQPN